MSDPNAIGRWVDYAEQVPGYYSRAELTRLAELARGKKSILEIGCAWGRSASVLIQAAAESGGDVCLVDPFCVERESALASMGKVIGECGKGAWVTLHTARSGQVDALDYWSGFDLIHIDGDHERDGITLDRNIVGWHAASKAGIAVFHDYNTRGAPEHGGGLVFPAIKECVDAMVAAGGWESLGVVDSQIALRRL